MRLVFLLSFDQNCAPNQRIRSRIWPFLVSGKCPFAAFVDPIGVPKTIRFQILPSFHHVCSVSSPSGHFWCLENVLSRLLWAQIGVPKADKFRILPSSFHVCCVRFSIVQTTSKSELVSDHFMCLENVLLRLSGAKLVFENGQISDLAVIFPCLLCSVLHCTEEQPIRTGICSFSVS